MVYAAASLRDVVSALGDAFSAQKHIPMTYNFAGSNTLARQIKASPRADVFLSADRQWADYLFAEGLLIDPPRKILRNSLVLISHPEYPHRLSSLLDLARTPFRHLAIAEPDAVPAGRYARSYLQAQPHGSGDLWQAIQPKVAPTLDVRAALALVEANSNILGIVYRTDARTSEQVRVQLELDPLPDTEVAYWGAGIAHRALQGRALEFLSYITGPEGLQICENHGFLGPTDPQRMALETGAP